MFRKPGKNDYSELKIYRFIVLLDILNKILKLIITKRLSDIAEKNNIQFFN